jgi:hypothetical protein
VIIAGPPSFVLWARAKHSNFASEGKGMHIDPKECHPAMDYAEHAKTYKQFIKLTLLTIVGVLAVMGALYLFVA